MKTPLTTTAAIVACLAIAAGASTGQVTNDECTGAIPIGEGITSGNNAGATTSSQASLCTSVIFQNQPVNDVWYLYTPSCTGIGRISLATADGGSSTPYASLAIYTGTCPASLMKIACDGQVFFQPRIELPVTAGTQLYVAVGSATGSGGPFNLSTQCFIPITNDECAGATTISEGVTSGNNFNATTSTGVSLTNCQTLIPIFGSDVWFSYVPSATGTALISTCACDGGSATFNAVLAAFSGSCAGGLTTLGCAAATILGTQARIYVPVVQGVPVTILVGAPATVTGSFNLVIVGYPSVTNDECASASPLGNGITSGHLFGATSSALPGPCAQLARDVWYEYTPPCSGVARFSLCPADGGSASFPPALVAYGGSCSSLGFLACNSSGCSPVSSNGATVSVPATQGVPIRIVVGTNSAGGGPFQLAVTCGSGPVNDTCAGAIPVSWGVNGPYDNTTASNGYVPTPCPVPTVAQGPDLWFSWTSTVTGNVHVDTCGSTFWPYVQVFDSCGGAVVGCANFDSSVCLTGSFVTFPAILGQSYRIRVAGYAPAGSIGQFHLRISGPYTLAISAPGPGKLSVTSHSGTPFASYFTGGTLNVGAYPNGWFFGIDLTSSELVSQAAWGFPHGGSLDATGSSPPLLIIGGVPPGLTIHAVSLTYDPATSTPIDVSAPVLFVTQ